MKYIITDKGEVRMGDNCFHKDLAQDVKGKVIAAGHVLFPGGRAYVFGDSLGFHLEAKKEDAKIIDAHLKKNTNEKRPKNSKQPTQRYPGKPGK